MSPARRSGPRVSNPASAAAWMTASGDRASILPPKRPCPPAPSGTEPSAFNVSPFCVSAFNLETVMSRRHISHARRHSWLRRRGLDAARGDIDVRRLEAFLAASKYPGKAGQSGLPRRFQAIGRHDGFALAAFEAAQIEIVAGERGLQPADRRLVDMQPGRERRAVQPAGNALEGGDFGESVSDPLMLKAPSGRRPPGVAVGISQRVSLPRLWPSTAMVAVSLESWVCFVRVPASLSVLSPGSVACTSSKIQRLSARLPCSLTPSISSPLS